MERGAEMHGHMTEEMHSQMLMHISPHLIAENHMLALSALELHMVLRQQVEENPALELSEPMCCPRCGAVMVDDRDHVCSAPQDNTEWDTSSYDRTEAYLDGGTWPNGSTRERTPDFDPLSLVAAPQTLAERVLADLASLLTGPAQHVIAEYLVGNLDESGFLDGTTSEAAQILGVSVAEVEHVLSCLQALEPAGIGARDLQECLLIQLKYLANQGNGNALAYSIVKDHFAELGAHKYNHIAQHLHVMAEDVVAAARFIREELNPFPAHQDSSQQRSAPIDLPRYVLPDIAIRSDGNDLQVEVVESHRLLLRLNQTYAETWQAIQRQPSTLSEQDRKHVRQHVSRANIVVASLNKRRQTMQKIGDFLANYQRDFLLYGPRHLKPLTRSMVAEYVGLHISVVSRATSGKWIMIPSGKVIPCSDFFKASLNVKDVIKEVIEEEDKPMTDQLIVERLAQRGHNVARRTVAKYRDQLGILPSGLRS